MSLRSSRTFCFEVLKFIPVGFILAIVAWSYYAYVVQMCICKSSFLERRFRSQFFCFCLVTIDNAAKRGKNKIYFLCEIIIIDLVIYLLMYHPLLFIFLWSYHRTISQRLMGPPREVKSNFWISFYNLFVFFFVLQFYLDEVESERIALAQTLDERNVTLTRCYRRKNLHVLTRHFDKSIRYCFQCRCIKPDRAHHCSLCGKCVLRYDHHCPW